MKIKRCIVKKIHIIINRLYTFHTTNTRRDHSCNGSNGDIDAITVYKITLSTGLARQIIVYKCVAKARVRPCVYAGEFLCEHVSAGPVGACLRESVRAFVRAQQHRRYYSSVANPILFVLCFVEMQQITLYLHFIFLLSRSFQYFKYDQELAVRRMSFLG